MANYKDVQDFHEKFGVPTLDEPGFLDDHARDFRIKFMQEELDEFKLACEEGNLEEAFDALLDLTYVVYGTADMMGFSKARWHAGWDEVQRANITKVRATDASQSKRGSALDVVKPEGWQKPNIQGVLDTPEDEL